MMTWRKSIAALLAGVVVLAYTGVPLPSWAQQPGARQPFSLWPASDAGFDLGVAGAKETPFRWRNIFLASAVIIRATEANAEAGEFVMAGSPQVGRGPGSGYLKLRVEPGAQAGTCALVAYGGTSNTRTVIANNIGGGGCADRPALGEN